MSAVSDDRSSDRDTYVTDDGTDDRSSERLDRDNRSDIDSDQIDVTVYDGTNSRESERLTTISYLQSRIYGLDYAIALGYYNQGLRKLNHLWEWGKLSQGHATALYWRNHIMQPIPRAVIDAIKTKYITRCMKRLGVKEWEISGDYRRGRDFDTKICVVARSDNYDSFEADDLQRLFRRYIPDNQEGEPSILEKVNRGIFRFVFCPELSDCESGRCFVLEITICSSNHYYAKLMASTGPKKFIDKVNQHIDKKFGRYHTLFSIADASRIGKVKSEEQLFQRLKIRFRPPSER